MYVAFNSEVIFAILYQLCIDLLIRSRCARNETALKSTLQSCTSVLLPLNVGCLLTLRQYWIQSFNQNAECKPKVSNLKYTVRKLKISKVLLFPIHKKLLCEHIISFLQDMFSFLNNKLFKFKYKLSSVLYLSYRRLGFAIIVCHPVSPYKTFLYILFCIKFLFGNIMYIFI